ncbi:SOS response-associated peptidase [Paracoccus sp. Z330]|uniref:Abasic site processing protein n=1 Tax=Paracoccus onchidii TaxID=3017813 RepID=A0ABT4ZI95_9RHOB|nr:SOS response-associated peptidase [Paracoccus onchidii]MDB6179077.1 SOS response-associated peptidase [Paracoccus onchidii]
MTRRSTPQAKIDDSAFPVRVLICVPEMGFGRRSDALHEWLATRIGRGNYAWHGGGRGGTRDRIALYFREPDAASACLTAFPDLELADGTCLPGYSSPYLPFGRPEDDDTVCNLYNQTTTQEAMRQLFKGVSMTDRAGNVAPGKVYPDQLAPIIRHDGGALELVKARWGMPSPPSVLKTQRDPGVTNVRNLTSPHWRRWLGPAHRCLVPVTAFAEPIKGGNQWFAPAEAETPMFFAGIEVRGWTSVRKVKDGETSDDLYAFLTCAPNAEVKSVHPKAMPVILTDPGDWETWLSAPIEIASKLQSPLPDGALALVDAPPEAS